MKERGKMMTRALAIERWERKPETVEVVRFEKGKLDIINRWINKKLEQVGNVDRRACGIYISDFLDGVYKIVLPYYDGIIYINEGDLLVFNGQTVFKGNDRNLFTPIYLKFTDEYTKINETTKQPEPASISCLIDRLSQDYEVSITLERKG